MADVNAQHLDPIYRGEDAVIDFAPATVTSISGWALAFAISEYPGLDELVTLDTAGGGVTITNAPAGNFRVTVGAATSTALSASLYAWDVWRTDAGSRERLAGGTVRVVEPVRRPS